MATTPRQFPVPQQVKDEIGYDTLTLDDMERGGFSSFPATALWSRRVLTRENRKILDSLLGDSTKLPRGLIAAGYEDDYAVTALVSGCNAWTKDGWNKFDADKSFKCEHCGFDGSLDGGDLDNDEDDEVFELEDTGSDFDLFLPPAEEIVPEVAPADDIFFDGDEAEEDYDDEYDDSLDAEEFEDLFELNEGSDDLYNNEVCPSCGAHPHTGQQILELSEEDVAAFVRSITDGADVLVFRPYAPKAFTDIVIGAAAPVEGEAPVDPEALPVDAEIKADVPDKGVPVAVVDELDKTAVLELVVVAPGPKVYIRKNGVWIESDDWKAALSSVAPPPVVKLNPDQLQSVTKQVDTYDAAGEKTPEQVENETPEEAAAEPDESMISASIRPMLSSYFNELQDEAMEVGAEVTLLAANRTASKLKNKAKNKVDGAERLRQYWGYGEGAAKIRWGSTGDWRRCYKHLSKYLGVRAKGYCNLMHARVTGTWPNGQGLKSIPNPAVSAEAVAKQLEK